MKEKDNCDKSDNLQEKTIDVKTHENRERGKWKKGFSGNPKGRPKGSFTIVGILKEEMEKFVPQDEKKKMEEKRTFAQVFVQRMLKKAIVDEDIVMMKEIMNRIDGRPKQSITINTEGNPQGEVETEMKKKITEKMTEINDKQEGGYKMLEN